MAKLVATYDLPLDDELAKAMIDKARERGVPLLSVEFDSNSSDMNVALPRAVREGFVLAEMVGELEQEFAAMGAPSVRLTVHLRAA